MMQRPRRQRDVLLPSASRLGCPPRLCLRYPGAASWRVGSFRGSGRMPLDV